MNSWMMNGRGGELSKCERSCRWERSAELDGWVLKYMRNEKVEMTMHIKLHARGKIKNKVGEEGRVEWVMVGNGSCSEMNEKNDEGNGLGGRMIRRV